MFKEAPREHTLNMQVFLESFQEVKWNQWKSSAFKTILGLPGKMGVWLKWFPIVPVPETLQDSLLKLHSGPSSLKQREVRQLDSAFFGIPSGVSPWRQHGPFFERPGDPAVTAGPHCGFGLCSWRAILSMLWLNGISCFHFHFQRKQMLTSSGSKEWVFPPCVKVLPYLWALWMPSFCLLWSY